MSDMRKLMDIMEGKANIASNVKTIQLETDPAGIMQVVTYLINPEKYQNNSTVGGNGLLSFYTDEEYNRTIELLKRFGVKFKEQGVNNADQSFNDPVNSVSPYSGNIKGRV